MAFRLGLPSGLTQAIFSLAMIMVQSLTNSFGEMLIAANVIIMRVDGFAMMPNFSFGTTMTTYAGQNVGAKQYDRVEQGAKQGTLMAMGVSASITAHDPYIWKIFDGDLHFDHRAGGSELLYDADPGCWLYRHGGDPEPFRRHERSRRHHDAHVDLPVHHSCGPRSGGLRDILAHQNAGASQWAQRVRVYLPAPFLDAGSRYDGCLL